MTKDEAIEVERKLFEAEMRCQYGTDILLARHADGPYIAMAWRDTFDGWLAAKRSIAQAPTSEAVAEKPQDDRASASPPERAFQDGAAASGEMPLPKGFERNEFDKWRAGSIESNWRSNNSELFAAWTAGIASAQGRGRAQGGITSEETPAKRDLYTELMDGFDALESVSAAQPAADPAPVPAQTGIERSPRHLRGVMSENSAFVKAHRAAEAAQGIDRAKRAEGERKAFEAWMINVAKCIIGSSDPYPAGMERDHWRTWQAAWVARGQQAGVPEHEAAVRFNLENMRRAEEYEARVTKLMALIRANHKFDWPYTDAFDDGGVAYHDAKRRILASQGESNV